MLVFIPAVGEFVIPELLGGPDSLMIGKVLWQEFFNNRDWARSFRLGHDHAAAVDYSNGSVPSLPIQKSWRAPMKNKMTFSNMILFVGLVFLYLPMIILMVTIQHPAKAHCCNFEPL